MPPPPLFAATLNSVEGEWGCAAGVMGGGGGLVGGTQTNAGEWQVCICPYQQAPISLTNR